MMPDPLSYRARTYRNNILKDDLRVYNVTIRETDLFISTDLDLTDIAFDSILKHRFQIESYGHAHCDFFTSLTPLPYDIYAHDIIRDMMEASVFAGVGPMAAVAGAIAEYVGRDLLLHSKNVVVENGGDIFINCLRDIHAGIFAGESPLSNRLSLLIHKEEMPTGVCTSSGTVGHSFSFGCADAVCVKSHSTSIADCAATAIGNLVKSKRDIRFALEEGMKIKNVLGIVIIVGDQLGAIGDMEIQKL